MQQESLEIIIAVVRRDPALPLGLLLLGIPGVLTLHMHLKLHSVGSDAYGLFTFPSTLAWRIPRTYLRERSLHSWSPWPAYGILLSFLIGFALLVVGVSRL